MIQCPECRKMIPDDSAYCDQCGKELKWCPQCKRPKRGTECPLCGSILVPGRQYLGGGLGVSGGSGASGGSGLSGASGGSGASGVSGGSGFSGASGGAAGGLGSSGGASRGGAPFGGAAGVSGGGAAFGGASGGGSGISGGVSGGASGVSGGGAASGGLGGALRGGAPFGGASGTSGGGIVPTALVGNGWRLILQEGPFGRTGGIWPELASCRYVSGNHGRISKTAAGWQVEDCGSTNGTFVNGARIQKQILKRGDILRIATLDFTID